MANEPDRAWEALRKCLPGLRKPASAETRSRAEVGAWLTRVEADVNRNVGAAFTLDDRGVASLKAGGRSYRAGRFATPTIGELEARIRQRGKAGALSFSVVTGEHPLTDIGALQATAGANTLFQVASQFNCLEAPGPTKVPIAGYVHDNTQGPRASVSAFPGTFLRHYAAPVADLLADAIEPEFAEVLNGYLTTRGVTDAVAFERALETNFEKIRIGVHDDIEVVFGGNWGGPVDADALTIAQTFTSTMALGGYSDHTGTDFNGACTSLLRAAYLGTLLAAFDLHKQAVVLTLIGGGAFANPPRLIWEALLWALDRAHDLAPADLVVVLNARRMSADIPHEDIRTAVQARNGRLVRLDPER
jgi:hypothetical protein